MNLQLNDNVWYKECVVEGGANVGSETCLYNAALRADINAINYFFGVGAGNLTDKYTAAIEGAIYANEPDIVDYIVNGVGERLRDSSNIGLYLSAKYGRVEIVDYFLDKGAQNILDSLNIAILENHVNVVETIVDFLPVLAPDAFYEAARQGRTDVLKFLMSENLVGDKQYYRALADAITNAAVIPDDSVYYRTLDYLLPLTIGELDYRSYYYIFGLAVNTGKNEIAKYMDRLRPVEKHGLNSYLITAAQNGNVEMVKYLIDRGATDLETALRVINSSNPAYAVLKAELDDIALTRKFGNIGFQ